VTPIYRILYVDDEYALLEIGKLFLEKSGQFSVDSITSAPAALTLLNSQSYDAVISDYKMPVMDGIEFLKAVRTSGNTIPFILFTGKGREEVVIEAINSGADFYLQKGGDPKSQFAELEHKILQAVHKHLAEASIRDLERRQADIINFLPDPTFAINTNGIVIAWNRAMEVMTGVTAAKILGNGNYEHANAFYHIRRPMLVDLILAPDTQFEKDKYDITVRDNKMLTAETTVEMANGTRSHLWGKASFLYDQNGNVAGAIESIRDITEQKQTKDALEKRLVALTQPLKDTGVEFEDLFDISEIQRLQDEFAKATGVASIITRTNGTPITKPSNFTRLCNDIIRKTEKGRNNCFKSDAIIGNPHSGGPVIQQCLSCGLWDAGASIVIGDRHIANWLIGQVRNETQSDESMRRYAREIGVDEQAALDAFHDVPSMSSEKFEAIARSLNTLANQLSRSAYQNVQQARFITDRKRAEEELLRKNEELNASYEKIAASEEELRSNLHVLTSQEQALRESEKKYRSVIENIQDLFYRSDRSGNLILASPSCLRKLGYESFEEILDKPISETFYYIPEKREELLQVLTEKGSIEDYEVQLKRKDGTPFWVSTYSHYYRDENGMIAGIEGVFRDITRRKSDEKALRESEEKFRSLVEYALEGILILDFEGKILFANYAAGHLIESDDYAGLVGKNVLEFIAPESRDDVIQDFIQISQGHDAYLANYNVISEKGTKIHIESVGKVITYEGKPADLISFRDITERIKTEEALRESEEKFRGIFAAESDGILVVERETGIIIDCNDAFPPMYGYRKDELIGQLNTITSAEPESSRAATKAGTRHIAVRYHKRKDGSIFPVEITANVISLQGRDVLIAAVRDITGKKLAEEALRQANRKLNLLSGITRHDINNQLAILRGHLALLEKKQPDTSFSEQFKKIQTSAQHISSMIQFTKEYESIGVNVPVWQDCRTLIETAAKHATLGPVNLKNDIPAGLEVFADSLVAKVFYNLIDNAVRHGGKISMIRFSVENRDGLLVVVCEDDGDGIPGELKEKIFDRGYGKNTGLGLFLSREILSITGISIRETGEPGKGARFEIIVPNGAYRI